MAEQKEKSFVLALASQSVGTISYHTLRLSEAKLGSDCKYTTVLQGHELTGRTDRVCSDKKQPRRESYFISRDVPTAERDEARTSQSRGSLIYEWAHERNSLGSRLSFHSVLL